MSFLKDGVFGLLIGIVNSLFGAGGGMISVPILKSKGLEQKTAQASTIAVILPICILSAGLYLFRGYFTLREALGYIPFTFLGGILGTVILRKISDKILRKIFAAFMMYLGIKMIMK